jgi:hypothetical protein
MSRFDLGDSAERWQDKKDIEKLGEWYILKNQELVTKSPS